MRRIVSFSSSNFTNPYGPPRGGSQKLRSVACAPRTWYNGEGQHPARQKCRDFAVTAVLSMARAKF